MKKAGSLPIVSAMMAALLLGSVCATYPQNADSDCKYFPGTGHYVCGDFLEFYYTRGGSGIFGDPLTEVCEDPARGLVQYFQRARMERHPANPDPYKVQLGLLVDELGYPPSPTPQIPAPGSVLHYYFPETGHVVSYAFLDYFRANGGIDIYGYPRSEFMYENDTIVQYFQRMRMEWHPEADSPIRLTNLGELYLERFGAPDDCEKVPDQAPDGISILPVEPVVTELDVSPSVRYAVVGRQATQTVFVYVNDQRQEPIQGASVSMLVHYPSGDQSYPFDPTNASGFTRSSFGVLPSPPGRKIVIDVNVTYDDLEATTQTFFIPWW